MQQYVRSGTESFQIVYSFLIEQNDQKPFILHHTSDFTYFFVSNFIDDQK